MTIILRLQGLNVKAGPEDIRTFFDSLHIPDGGVYIVGGSLREAFIAFKTERDAQLAMRYNGSFLKGSRVTLHISSMAELEHKLKSLLEQKPSKLVAKKPRHRPEAIVTSLNVPSNANAANLSPSAAMPPDPETANLPHVNAQHVYPDTANVQTSLTQSLDSGSAFLLGMYTILQGLQSSNQTQSNNAVPTAVVPEADSRAVAPDENRTPGQTLISNPGYVRLFGLSASATKKDICWFFQGLDVQEAIVNVKLGDRPCCLVKFANNQDASDALRFNQRSLGPICVEVRQATKKMWAAALKDCEMAGVEDKERQNLLTKSVNLRQKPINPLHLKRQSVPPFPSKTPKKPRPYLDLNTPVSRTEEYIVMVTNLPTNITKTEIKDFFGCPNISHKNVLHLLDMERNRTDTAFLIFDRNEDYNYAMNLTGCHVGSDAIEVSSISKEEMWKKMAESKLKYFQSMDRKKKPNQRTKVETLVVPSSSNRHPAAQTCLFVRNMPADVDKSQIKSLFSTYEVRKDNITLLCDSDGNGIGEAVVQFKSEKLAALAERIHGTSFLGAKVLLTRINVKQMEDLLARNV
ncbi:RNA binding motif protein 12Ba [Parambassis ranga]|uniref:RNA-binding protein 12B n=1 Tax=Parambassis ranga TaxID=210632 RepID=A0A6P7JY80_9TELE|nr:RNA-binding protein 12B [Parambassis ranga]XP_028281599.1 RNA-binding protein 12B [Parambassis ranga]XP_028281600.1 RNA-binding protein 12B [Parambassis ranga]XP_028281601.1 RNA-binding protein 12B [Parambassis ranga]XP_028281602.1 RNA-binding protein 12B [Parambassis ranga]